MSWSATRRPGQPDGDSAPEAQSVCGGQKRGFPQTASTNDNTGSRRPIAVSEYWFIVLNRDQVIQILYFSVSSCSQSQYTRTNNACLFMTAFLSSTGDPAADIDSASANLRCRSPLLNATLTQHRCKHVLDNDPQEQTQTKGKR